MDSINFLKSFTKFPLTFGQHKNLNDTILYKLQQYWLPLWNNFNNEHTLLEMIKHKGHSIFNHIYTSDFTLINYKIQ